MAKNLKSSTNTNLGIIADTVYSISSPSFSNILGNRVTTKDHIRKIKNAMRLNEWFPPIIVDLKTKQIVDGQNRYAAASELWKEGENYPLKVMYAEFENPLQAAREFNNKSKHWLLSDFIYSYVASGNQQYIRFNDYVKNHSELSYSSAIQLLTNTASSTKILRSGELNLTDKNYETAEQLYKELVQMVKVSNDPDMISRGTLFAYTRNRDFILGRCGSFENWLKCLTNWKKPKLGKADIYTAAYLGVLPF